MDLLLELLEDPAYRHVLINHLPLTGLAFAWLILLWGTIEGRWRSIVFALSLVAATSGSVLVVMNSGDDAYPFVYDMLDGVSRDWLDHHTRLADRWGRLLIGNAVLAALAIAIGYSREASRRLVAIALLATTCAALGVAALIAQAGGQIRHPEFRMTDPPRDAPSIRLP